MKIQGFQKTGWALAAVLAISTAGVFAQSTTIATPTPQYPAPSYTTQPNASTAPAVSPGTSQILLLSQAKVSDSTIITYIQNSGTVYGLDAPQIVYLKQQGVSEPVINAMLNQRTAMAAEASQQPPQQFQQAPVTAGQSVEAVAQPTTPPPSTTYIVPDTQTYDYDNWAYPYTYPYYSYPYYGWPVGGIYWGWGGYGGWHGGGFGGWHGGGAWHGSVGGGWHSSGGFHTGGGWHR